MSRKVDDDLVVYDLEREKAYFLTSTAVLVWRHCDGRTSAVDISRFLEGHLGERVDGDLVSQTLRELVEIGLVEWPEPEVRVSRKTLVRKASIVTIAAAGIATPIAAAKMFKPSSVSQIRMVEPAGPAAATPPCIPCDKNKDCGDPSTLKCRDGCCVPK